MNRRRELIERLLKRYGTDESVLGVILVGSAGKGYEDEESDVDLEIVVTEDKYRILERKGQKVIHVEKYDLIFTTMSRLQQAEASERDEDHWWYIDCPVLLDKTGRLERTLEEIARYHADSRLNRLKRYYLGYWQNSLCSMGCLRHENEMGARIYAALAAQALIRLLFNVNYRWAPKIQWAFKEVRQLKRRPGNLESKIEGVLEKPDCKKLSKLWEETAELLREEKYTWVDEPEQIL